MNSSIPNKNLQYKFISVVCLILYLIVSHRVIAQEFKYADSKPAQAMKQFDKAYNMMNRNALEEYTNNWYFHPDSTDVLQWLEIQSQYGQLEPKEVWTDLPNFYEVWFYSPKLRVYSAIGLKLSKENGKIIATAVARGARPESDSPPFILEENFLYHVQEYLEEVSRDSLFTGAVAIYKDGKPLTQFTCGYKNRVANQKNNIDTRMNTASVTKSITATAIGILVDQGKISFTDKISKYLPEYPKVISDVCTIGHLLSHTSGIELDFDTAYKLKWQMAKNHEDILKNQLNYVDELIDSTGKFNLSGKYDYSNEGFDLAGIIIERASGIPYLDFIQKYIFKPIDINLTNKQLSGQTEDVAIGYTHYKNINSEFSPTKIYENNEYLFATPHASASLFLTADEINTFVEAFARGYLVSDSVKIELTTPHSLLQDKTKYGYGFELVYPHEDSNEYSYFGHIGGVRGGSAMFGYWLNSKYCLVVLSNERFRALPIADYLSQLINRF